MERRYPLVNAAASPMEYLSDPAGMFAAVKDMRRLGIDLLAVYHSHPLSEPVPSRTDLANNFYPEVMHLIISLKESEPRLRSWWLSSESYREAEWRLTEDAGNYTLRGQV